METAILKVFFSVRDESEWLNSMGKSGYLLTGINHFKYYFSLNDDIQYTYYIENLAFSSESDEATCYFDDCRLNGIISIFCKKNRAYFISEKTNAEKLKTVSLRNKKYHFWKAVYYTFFSLCGSVICGYQAFSIDFLIRLGQAGDGRITNFIALSRSNSTFTAIINLLKRFCNLFIKLINKYFDLWTSVFGEYEPIAVISIIAPLTLLLWLFAGFHIDEYFRHRELSINSKQKSSEEEVENDGKQTV